MITSSTNVDYLVDSVRLRLGDFEGTVYSQTLIRTAIISAIKFLQKRWKSKYQVVSSGTYTGDNTNAPSGYAQASTVDGIAYIPLGLNLNDAYRNPFVTFTQDRPPVVEQNDEDAIVLATAYIVHLAKLTNSSSTFVSWSTEDIRFTNTTAANTMRAVLETLQTELNTLFATRIAQPIVSRQPVNIITGIKVY
jgi:hypothetical protein